MSFSLTDNFINGYKRKRAPFGFNGLGALVYMRTYSRIKEDGSNEQWWETVRRVVEGTYNMQRKWIAGMGLEWNA
jgi:ribonucleoside-triphosphate reductase (thioredoxin)